MQAHTYKAIISDIDGTLVPIVPDAIPSEKVADSVKKAIKAGVIFSLASGRPYSLIQYLVEYLGLTGPCITDNGAVIVDTKDGSALWEASLSNGHANKILSLSTSYSLVRASCDSGNIENPKHIPTTTKVRKISVHDILMIEADELIDKVNTELKDISCVKAASYKGERLTDVYLSDIHATKQHAVLKLAELLKIEQSDMIGVGDGYNDFPLLMACGLKVAMGNAVDELKAIADYVAPKVDNDGLSDVIEKYCL